MSARPRVAMIDIARFYGILLVYYGHFVEQILYLGNATAALQYKFIYSFHMPLFYFLAGYVASEQKLKWPFARYIKYQAASRLLPYFLFTLLMIPLHLAFQGNMILFDKSSLSGYLGGGLRTLLGLPVFNIPTWFLASLVSVELLHYLMGRHLNTQRKLLLTATVSYLFGYFLNLKFNFFSISDPFRWNYWLAHEAFTVYPFYLLGLLMHRRRTLIGPQNPLHLALGALICALVVLYTFPLNQGPFRFLDAVVILLGAHGNILLFPFTALVGILCVLLLARLSPPVWALTALGRNVMVIFCLNGVFYHFLNHHLAKWFVAHSDGGPWALTAMAVGVTTASLLLCLPVVVVLQKYLPQLVGRPRTQGPLLPALIREEHHSGAQR